MVFVRTFCGSYMNSDSCCVKAGGSVVPHGPWKWCLENITQMLRLNDITLAFELQLLWHCSCPLTGLRKVFSFGCCFGVEFCYWDTPGGNQGTEHGCWVNDRGGAHLQFSKEPAKTSKKCLIKKNKQQKKNTSEYHDVHWGLHNNSPQGKGHRLPSLFPLLSGYESPWFLQKTPCWVSADRCNRACHTLTAAGKITHWY